MCKCMKFHLNCPIHLEFFSARCRCYYCCCRRRHRTSVIWSLCVCKSVVEYELLYEYTSFDLLEIKIRKTVAILPGHSIYYTCPTPFLIVSSSHLPLGFFFLFFSILSAPIRPFVAISFCLTISFFPVVTDNTRTPTRLSATKWINLE